MCLEESFEIEFSRETLLEFETVSDVVAYLSRHFFRDVAGAEPVEAAFDLGGPDRPATAHAPARTSAALVSRRVRHRHHLSLAGASRGGIADRLARFLLGGVLGLLVCRAQRIIGGVAGAFALDLWAYAWLEL